MNNNVPFKKRIYVNHDFTKKQRENYKLLREELKARTLKGEKNLAIRGNRIVTIKPKRDNDIQDDDKIVSDVESSDEEESEESSEEDEDEEADDEGEKGKDDDEEGDLVPASSLFD